MDHRCLYGHRVPAAFTFAIQNRSCPTCGSPTVTINGYQAARTLATDAGLDAVAAFHAIRVLEAQWVLTPAEPAQSPAVGVSVAGAPAPAPAPVAAPATPPEEEEVVVEDEPPVIAAPAVGSPVTAPEPRITPRIKPDKSRPEPRIEARIAPPPAGPSIAAPVQGGPGFGKDEEDFFKGA